MLHFYDKSSKISNWIEIELFEIQNLVQNFKKILKMFVKIFKKLEQSFLKRFKSLKQIKMKVLKT